MPDAYDGMELEDAPAPAGADPYAGQTAVAPQASAADPYDGMDLDGPPGASATQAAAQATEDGSADAPMQEVTVTAKRPEPDSSWRDTLASVIPTVASKFQSRVAGAQEFLGTKEQKDARTKLWQSMVLPDAAKEAKAAGNVAIYELPQVIEAAKHVGVRPDIFARDWQDYADMSPADQEALYKEQVAKIQEGTAQSEAGAARRESAESDRKAFAVNASGWSPKNIVAQTLTGIPDLVAGIGVGVGTGAVAGPVAGAAASTAYFVGTAAPEEYAEARNQGADHDTATTYATLSALANAIPEVPVLKAVTDGGAARKIIVKAINEKFADSLGGRAINSAASQALAQTVVSAAQQSIDAGVLDKHVTLGEALSTLAQSALVGGLSGAPLGAMHGGSHAAPEAPKEDTAAQPTEPKGEAAAPQEPSDEATPAPQDQEKTRSALQAVLDKTVDPGQIEHLEGLGLATRNDVGIPRLLPSGRRKLLELNQPDAEEKEPGNNRVVTGTDTRTPTAWVAGSDKIDSDLKGEHADAYWTSPDTGVSYVFKRDQDGTVSVNTSHPGEPEGDQASRVTKGIHDLSAPVPDGNIGAFLAQNEAKASRAGLSGKETPAAEPQVTQHEAHQSTDSAHGVSKGDIVTVPDGPDVGPHGGERARVQSIFRHGDDQQWTARLQTETGATIAVNLPHGLEKGSGLELPEAKPAAQKAEALAPDGTKPVGGLAPRPESLPLEERLKSDERLRDTLTRMKDETGWSQRGGNVLMDEDGKAIGRTTWIPHHEWYADKPDGATEEQIHTAIDKGMAGGKLGSKQRAILEHVTAEADRRNLPAGQEDFDEQLTAAREATDTNPTSEQKASGDYKKGGLEFAGLPVKLESPMGSKRSGTSKNGKKWSRTMGRDYGYIDGTKSSDGEGVDVFLAGRPDTGHVYVVNQKNADGSFDETKSVLGAMSADEAKAIYMSHYPKGWRGFGSIVSMPTHEFAKWVKSKAPLREAVERKPARTSDMNEFQLRQALRSHELTGLPNRRAYNEDPKLAYQASLDVDSLKWINDNFGHDAGDQLLKHVAEVLREHVDDLYHISGDEFVAQGENEAELHKQLQAAVKDLQGSRIHHEMADGRVARLDGMGLSYGVGKDLHEAEHHLQAAKSSRETEGLRAPRGEKPAGASVEDAREREAREADLYEGHPVEHDFVSEHQTDFFGTTAVPKDGAVNPGTGRGAEPVAPKRAESQLQMFTPDDAPAARPARTASRTQLAEVGRFHSGIKVVRKWQDAAHIFAPLRKSPQESMMALALDASGKPLAVLRHSIGDQSGAAAVPHLIIGALSKIPHIAGVYFGHNHPSGEVGQSNADIMITDKLHDLLRESGIDPLGMVVVAPGTTKASFYHPAGGYPESVTGETTAAPRKKAGSVPVVERRFKRIPTTEQRGTPATSPASVKEYLKAATAKSGDTGLLVLNGRHGIVGHMQMTADQMRKLRTGSKDSGIAHLAGQLEDMNASAVIPFGREEDPGALHNVGTALREMSVNVLDSFTKDSRGNWISAAEHGRPTSGEGPFYSRAQEASAGMPIGDLHRTIRKTIRDSGMQAGPGFPHIEVHRDFTTLPRRLREHVQAGGAERTAGAVYDPATDRIHMIAGNLGTEKEAQETLWHEAVGHHGLRLIMDGDRYRNTMDGIWNAMPDRVRATALRNGLDVEDLTQRRLAAEEVIAYAAGQHLAGTAIDKPLQPFWRRAFAAVKGFFAKTSGKPFTTDADIAKIIAESKSALESRAGVQRDGEAARSGRAPTFHSAVERAVDASKQAKASADQWLATLRKTPGVKAEEMSWLGVEDWLKAHDGPVTKADLQDFIKSNQLHLEETVHGGSLEKQTDLQQKQTQLAEKLRAKGYTIDFSDLGELHTVRPPDTETYSAFNIDPYETGGFAHLPDEHQDLLEQLRDTSKAVANETLGRMHENPQHEGWDRIDTDTTRYEDYTLPGGTNYREMLIRRPAAEHISRFNVRNPNGSIEFEQHATRDAADAAAGRIGGTVEPIRSSDTNAQNYRSGHWPEPNILAHVRFKDRTDAEGKKVLFLEELQSDWHQAGRKHGYTLSKNGHPPLPQGWAVKPPDETNGSWRMLADADDPRSWQFVASTEADLWKEADSHLREQVGKPWGPIPDAPFKTTWPSLIMKRMIRHAAEGGYDRIAWTTGDQQNARYQLEKHISRIEYQKREDGTHAITVQGAGGERIWSSNNATKDTLRATLGDEMTQKILNDEGRLDEEEAFNPKAKVIDGEGLKMGGAGMRGFYDDILPRETGKLIGKFGAKVGETKIHAEKYGASGDDLINAGRLTLAQWKAMEDDQRTEALKQFMGEDRTTGVHSFDITPELREHALSQGFPMYWKKPSQQALKLQNAQGPKWYEKVRAAVDHLVNNPITNDFRKIFVPTSMDEDSRRTARLATAALGKLAHNTHETQHALEAFSRQIDKLPPREQLEMMDAIEHGLPQPNAELQPVADVMRKLLDTNRDKVRALGIGALDNFIENYFPHYWADPDEAKRMMATIMGRRPLRGPASFLKMRTIPTIKEGLDAGLTPLTINPLVLTLLKVREMQRFVTGVKMMQDLKDAHLAQFLPAGKPMPSGWVAINDNSAKVRQWSEEENGFIERGQYIMPENAGRLINNHVGRSAIADFMPLHAMRVGSNFLNSMQLGFSAFHLGFTTLDASVSKVALATERLAHGEPGRAAAALLEGATPLGAAMNLRRGMALLKAYSDPSGATPAMAKVVSALEAGGGRVSMDRYYLAIQGASPFHGAGVVTLAGDIKAALKGPQPIKGALGAVARFPVEYGRKMYRGLQEMVAIHHPLQIPFEIAGRVARAGSSLIMEHIVPMQKLGVFSDLAHDYLRRNPNATDDQLADAMQSAWRSVDNRLGEMVYDNQFWNRTLKDTMHLSVRAVGWNWGTLREIGGAPADALKMIDKLVTTGKITGDDLGHKIPYIIGLTMTVAMLGATINYMFTGQGPQELKDYFFPRTGGVTTHGTPERVSLPSYMKDIYEYSQRPGQTVVNKLNPLFGIVASIWSNEDYFGDPIAEPTDPGYKQLLEKAQYAAHESTPFSIQGTKQIDGSDKNDMAGKVKRAIPFIGITPAPGYITSPDQIERQSKFYDEQKYAQELRYKLKKAAVAGDKDRVKELTEQYIESRKRQGELKQGMDLDKAKAAALRHQAATSMRKQGYPATGGLIASLPLQPDSEARAYFARIAGAV